MDAILPGIAGTTVAIDIEDGIQTGISSMSPPPRSTSSLSEKRNAAVAVDKVSELLKIDSKLSRSKETLDHEFYSRSNSSLSSVSLGDLQRSPRLSSLDNYQQDGSILLPESITNKSPIPPPVQFSRDIFSRGSSGGLAERNVSRSKADFNGISSRPSTGKSTQNGAIMYNSSSEISELSNMPEIQSPFLVTRDFIPSRTPPSPAAYRVATKSVPKRPNSASRPRSTISVPEQKEKIMFVTQSISNIRNPSPGRSLSGGRNSFSTSSTSSSESRPATGKASALSKIASSLFSKSPSTSKPSRAWDVEKDLAIRDLPARPSTSRPGTSKSIKSTQSSSAESAVFLSDPESSRDDENCDLQWRVKLRPNCFLPSLSEKFLCPTCTNVLYYPVQLSNCDHHVCSSCLANIMRGVGTCPVDKKPVDRSQVIVNRQFSAELSSKELSCPQSDVGCQWIGTYENFKAHYMSCEHTEILCPNGCGLQCERRLVDEHTTKECSHRMVTCEFCLRAIRASKEIDHLKQCPRFPMSCTNSCGMKEIPRGELSKHIEGECPFGEMKCPFKRMGCYVTGTREFIRRHITDDLASHMDMICLGLDQNADKIQQHEEVITQQRSNVEENKGQISNLLLRQGCQFLWKIDNWSQRTVEAIGGRKTILKSPPFYSGKYGYKLGLTLMPNGDGAAKGNSMSVYVCICKGEYDALQTWPFAMAVTFILVDQCQDPRAKVDHSFVLRPNPCKENLPFLGRPTTNANPSIGAQYFAPLDMLDSRDYIRDDVIFIKVLVESDTL